MVKLTVVALLTLASSLSAQTPVPKELAALQGRWVLTSIGGEAPKSTDPEGILVVTGDKYEQLEGGRVTESGTIKVNLATKPASFDFIIGTGRFQGMTQLAIFEITGDTIKFHLTEPGTTVRPTDFTPKPGFEIVTVKRRG